MAHWLEKEYPKSVRLKDGSSVTVRPMVPEDKDKLLNFFRQLPEEDRLFLKEDVTDERVIERWVKELNYDRVLPLVAEADEEIVADATLHRDLYGWSRHVGEIRVVVAREFQHKGLGTIMARELFHMALKIGLDKIMALMMETQEGAQRAFKKLGFKKEAVLKDHVADLHGKKHDLIIMTNNVRALVETLDDLIKDMELSIESRVS